MAYSCDIIQAAVATDTCQAIADGILTFENCNKAGMTTDTFWLIKAHCEARPCINARYTLDSSAVTITVSNELVGGYIRLVKPTQQTIHIPENGDFFKFCEPPLVTFRITDGVTPAITLGAGVVLNDPKALLPDLVDIATFAIQWVGENEWDII